MLFRRGIHPNGLAHLAWDIYCAQLCGRDEDSVWAAYHIAAAARYFPYRPFLIVDRETWNYFSEPSINLIPMFDGNWVNHLLYQMETINDTTSGTEADDSA